MSFVDGNKWGCFFLLIPLSVLLAGCATHTAKNPRELTELKREGKVLSGFSGAYKKFHNLDFLSYEELLVLSTDPSPDGLLGQKLNRFFSSSIIDNRAWYKGARPQKVSSAALGPLLRVGTWNVEKSLNVSQVIEAIKSEASYVGMIDSRKAPEKSSERQLMLQQRERLLAVDILFLQEMDIGMSRSGYINAAEKLAQTLDMNYAYAPQMIEVDPVALGLEPRKKKHASTLNIDSIPRYKVEPSRFQGAFGSAVLSRYPIKKVQVIPLQTLAYDWYESEKKKTHLLEKTRRFGAELVFKNVSTREMKVGKRHFFRVDVEVPGCGPNDTLTLINIHLEIKCKPQVRVLQMREILSYIADIPNPIIMAGDFNSSAIDLSPTSVVRELHRAATDPASLVPIAYEVFLDLDLASFAHRGVNFIKNMHSPLAFNIPIIFPNKVKPLIDEVEAFRFTDGSTFDFRGDKKYSFGSYSGTLSNSNQKHLKGHVSTFQMKRPIGPLGLYRLDWMFVRSGLLTEPKSKNGSYQFAPHFAETLRAFNCNLVKPFSDHRPSIIDLPLGKPHQNK